jgi:NACalpha-BTF3-like transcription factor
MLAANVSRPEAMNALKRADGNVRQAIALAK